MERQVYPNRLNADGTAEPPYDVAGWTLPLQMGVRASLIAERLPGSLHTERLERVENAPGVIENDTPETAWYTLDNTANDDFLVLNALLAAGVNVDRLPTRTPDGALQPHSGSLRFLADAKTRKILEQVLPHASTQVRAWKGEPFSASGTARSAEGWVRLRPRRRIGLYQPYVPSMDEGWTRLVLENHGFAYTTIHHPEIRNGDLRSRFDVVVLPAIPAKTLRDGYGENESEPAFVGGLGPEGAESLRGFVRGGGTLVCLDDSTDYAIEELALPVKSVLNGLKTSEFYAPGSILHVTAGDESVLSTGVPAELSAYFDRSRAFVPATSSASESEWEAATVLKYAAQNVLESGWLLGSERIQGKAALVVLRRSNQAGRVILFGFPPQHRGQTHGTFRLLFNALTLED